MARLFRRLSHFFLLTAVVGALVSAPSIAEVSFAQSAAAAKTAAGSLASPESVGLSSEVLGRIPETIQRSINDGRISGEVVLIARHGKVVYFKAVGMADRDEKTPMQTDSIFRICSMSKPITTAAVMMLYEEGRFTLDEPVADFLPEFKSMKVLDPPYPQDTTSPPGALVDAKRPITIFNLLTHTSGLTYHWNLRLGKAYDAAGIGHGISLQEGTIGDMTKKLAAQPLIFQPGDQWEYSLADDVLGRLVEVVSGMPLDKFLEQRVFKPLGMKDTYFFLPEDKVARIATAYTFYPGKGLQPILDGQIVNEGLFHYTADYPYRGPKSMFSGGGGLVSTAEDYYRFCQMMLNGGTYNGVRLLSRKSVELISEDHITPQQGGMSYGLGFGVNSDTTELHELGSLGAFYWGGFYYTDFVIDPKEDLITVVMGQLHPTGGLDLNTRVRDLAYAAIEK